MPSLKYLKSQSELPIQEGDIVTIQDMFGFEFEVTVKKASIFSIVATEAVKDERFFGMQEIPIVGNGFLVVSVNGVKFEYGQFFNENQNN